MPCHTVKLGNSIAIVCTRGQRTRRCSTCGSVADGLCDYPKGKGTCDKPLCRGCAVHPDGKPEVDYCPDHPQPQPSLFDDL
jgi:hypothetical protein